MSRTPWVLRPCTEISSTVVRTSVPVELMSMISCPGMTCSAATVTPLRSEVCSAITPWAAAAVRWKVRERRALAVARRGGRQHVTLTDHDQRDQILACSQTDAAHTGRLAPHVAHFVLVEADGLAAARHSMISRSPSVIATPTN